ncbi:hypothetical protein Poli38472_009414 [Pythium oligandrum]|uniref:Primary ciliary dyskinesia protein 1 n=1 Tax=Pythium oligandrum TaxID=41045 RepID=A0A8K1CMT9_PYTOL|nr:hypothetical protein Poli38472_009414 [Pythium oligandrum]|eukprot:TMW65247.1 hypothetical protein Poli38472_009414 [Pythium oligandrum]
MASPTKKQLSKSSDAPALSVRPPSRPGPTAPSSPSRVDAKLLYTQPTSVHFSGFALNQTYQQRVFVHNNSSKPVRLQYSLPTKPFFRASFPNERKPFISPGLQEELLVTFKPSAFQYYYDCIQVRCEQVAYGSNTDAALLGKCLLPLHAYPVVNEVAFPTRMDFGAVPLGSIARKHFDITCSVPIEFEYELQLVKAHPSFTVFPLKGSIPANGVARIEFEFRPLIYATASAEIELLVSQLDFKPMRCALTGSSSSDLMVETAPIEAKEAADKAPAVSPSAPRDGSEAKASPKSPTRRSKNDSKQQQRGSTDQEPELERVGSLQIPQDLSNMASVNFILTQQPGKLKPKDLKKAIEANRAMQQQQQAEALKAMANDENDANACKYQEIVSPAVLSFQVLVREEATAIARTRTSRQIREMLFQQELSEIARIESELEFQSHKIRLGEELLTPEQLELLHKMREMNARMLQRDEREKLRHTVENKAFNMFTPPTPEQPYPPRGLLPAHFQPTVTPDFKMYKNDLWARRKRVVQRFVRAISTVILRNRVQKRLTRLKDWLGDANTRLQVQAKVARDWQQHHQGRTASSHIKSKPASTETAQDRRYYLEGFPLVEEKEHKTRSKRTLPVEYELKFDPFAFFPLRERDEALMMGHTPLELPPLPTYVPLEDTRVLRVGALDECSVHGPLRLESGTQEQSVKPQDRMPSILELLPRDVFLRGSAAFRPLLRIQSPRETQAHYNLRPQRVFRTPPRHWGAQLETAIGSRSLFSLKTGLLRIHERFTPATERPRTRPLLSWLPNADTDDLFRDLWDVVDSVKDGVPALAERPDDVPCLSDSESDDEGEKAKQQATLPTWDDAVRLWDEENDDDDKDDGVAYEQGELLGRVHGVTSFPRYRHLIQLEREYNTYREERLQKLPSMLKEVASHISHPDYALVVDGHGPARPLHTLSSQD